MLCFTEAHGITNSGIWYVPLIIYLDRTLLDNIYFLYACNDCLTNKQTNIITTIKNKHNNNYEIDKIC